MCVKCPPDQSVSLIKLDYENFILGNKFRFSVNKNYESKIVSCCFVSYMPTPLQHKENLNIFSELTFKLQFLILQRYKFIFFLKRKSILLYVKPTHHVSFPSYNIFPSLTESYSLA